MSLKTATFLEGATITPSGGTTKTLAELKSSNGDSLTCYVSDDTSLLTRRTATFTVKEPRVSTGAPNGYTQGRSHVLLKFPRTLANGNQTVDTVKIEMSTDIEASEADKLEYCKTSSQYITGSAFAQFWQDLSLA